ncbi:uncharacterized protein LOC106094822 [Stomoxys calcitrans]|uniref:Uncharacterized protein n=1 Tax=Stomoxys calcitrans TaxID=35570 RepID=A0A1I8P2I8_STOCA|nr:uncharacterized protein LOC106094822 [Stomoxys calcitrans]
MSSRASGISECVEENADEKLTINGSNSILDNSGEVSNASSYRLHTSCCSTISNDSEISSLSLCLDKEMETYSKSIDIDELPAFEVRLISPLGRTPSPIDSEDMATPTHPHSKERLNPSPCINNPDYVALHDINAQISPPSDNNDHPEEEQCLSRTSSLETIFEGVFLNTPPRPQVIHIQRYNRSRTNLEKVVLNRLQTGKENKSPLQKSETPKLRHAYDSSPNFRAENRFS